MAKPLIQFSCSNCHASYSRWQGKCDSCNEWNSLTESAPDSSGAYKLKTKSRSANVVNLNEKAPTHSRLTTGIDELNRVLGGGIVAGSAILIGGDPGIGKSTLLLQACAELSNKGAKVLYISGEESASQIQMRASRLGLNEAPMQLANTGSLETILTTIKEIAPDIVVIDSIQTIYSGSSDSAPGTVSQIRVGAHELIQKAKATGCSVIFVGHVTKDGNIAGPRVLEHMVDTVLYFEGDRGNPFRLLRSFKNRFGATNEIGVFEMGDKGLSEVANPSAMFLEQRPESAAGSVVISAINGTRPVLVEIQALVTTSPLAQPRRTTLGVDPNRVAMIAAVLDKHCGFHLAKHDIFLNVTGGLKITEPAADLAIAAALISSITNKPINHEKMIFGEVGLSGEIRGVSHMNDRIKESTKLGLSHIICPEVKNLKQRGATLTSVKNINQLSASLW